MQILVQDRDFRFRFRYFPCEKKITVRAEITVRAAYPPSHISAISAVTIATFAHPSQVRWLTSQFNISPD